MPNVASPFASVKLPTSLVQQAREAAQPQRRSVAGQIEYWATLGRIAGFGQDGADLEGMKLGRHVQKGLK